ncbi:uncharacterized protein O3C94_023166 [Discoglossus pictus]
MTPAVGSILLGLVLCSVVTWAIDKGGCIEEKPGVCPVDVLYPRCSGATEKVKPECNTDKDCKGAMKCCFSGCRQRCLLPLADKMDSCPYYNTTQCMLIRPMPDECHSDNQCQGSFRCCCFSCRRQCMATVKVKPGQCPAKKKLCPAIAAKDTCQNDGQCLNKMKCCDQCGKKCVSPVSEHAGYCPEDKEQLSCGNILGTPLCTADADCKKNHKCCVSNNQMQCVTPVKVKSGECPVPLTACLPIHQTKPKCQSDRDCPGAKKCCTPFCKQECTDPSIVKVGSCPVVNTLVACKQPGPAPLCEGDAKCPGNQKCCDYGCQVMCVEPVDK